MMKEQKEDKTDLERKGGRDKEGKGRMFSTII